MAGESKGMGARAGTTRPSRLPVVPFRPGAVPAPNDNAPAPPPLPPMPPPAPPPRRHDIDALRALAFALVIVYHVGMYYVADWDWHLKSPHATTWLQVPMRLLNLWRMDLVFLVSGIALALLARSGRRWTLLGQRSLRLLLPLAFGMLVVVPYQPYAQGVAKGLVEPGFGAFLLRYFSGGPWPANAFDG